jgi:hypothetical protein
MEENEGGKTWGKIMYVVHIKEIFQDDSLLPILFCIALIPLSHELNRFKCGYQVYGTERKIHHLLYMDNLKLIGEVRKN